MKKIAILTIIIALVLAVVPGKAATKASVGVENELKNNLDLLENAVEVSPGVFYLGESMDKGRVVEGYVFVHYAKGDEPATESKPVFDDTVDIYKLMYGGIKWADTMQYEVNSVGSELNPDDVMSTLSASLETWDSETSFELFGPLVSIGEGATPGVLDEHNIVVWRDLSEIFGADVIAVNYFWFYRTTKEMVESDVAFNTYYEWGTSGEPSEMDLQNIATHEFGHNGLNDLYMPKSVALTMYGYGSEGETDKRDLGTGDISGIQALYGN